MERIFLVKSQGVKLLDLFQIRRNVYFQFSRVFLIFAMYKNADRGNREQSSNSPDHATTNSETTNPNFLINYNKFCFFILVSNKKIQYS